MHRRERLSGENVITISLFLSSSLRVVDVMNRGATPRQSCPWIGLTRGLGLVGLVELGWVDCARDIVVGIISNRPKISLFACLTDSSA